MSPTQTQPTGSGRALHLVAIVTAAAIVPLILAGAGVTSKEAGLVFPDWPTSNDALLNPPGWLSNDHMRWEHGHRLLGWMVGMLAIGLAALSWRKRGWVRLTGLGTLLAIIVQGVLGGLRVTEISTGLAMIHGIWGQICFCTACIAALITSPAWVTANQRRLEVPGALLFRRIALITTIALVGQLAVGAAYRHFAFGWALAAHLIGAAIVILLLSFTALWALEQYGSVRIFSRLGKFVVGLVGAQMFLGGAAFLVVVMGGSWPPLVEWAVPSAHVVVGALLLACMVVLTLCSYRVLSPAARTSSPTGLAAVSA